ncbi:MAG: LamB/YcsF family protein [Candidatus Eremiobacteraeota bacterium]|nr:LamB/YcsF family protein [Candidatus Eremiobacteraeota bacterium]
MTSSLQIDLNADVAESFGALGWGDAEPLFEAVTSANIACGLHAGGPEVIGATIQAALRHGVKIGAHPSYDDRASFGRTPQKPGAQALRCVLAYQLGALQAVAQTLGARLTHVKPHGALYNDSAKDATLAAAIAQAVAAFDPSLVLVGLAGSLAIAAAAAAGLRTASEAFCDRRYEADGSLRSREHADAVLRCSDEVAAQALSIATQRRVRTVGGSAIDVQAQTLCIHGDHPQAPATALQVRAALQAAGVSVRPFVDG